MEADTKRCRVLERWLLVILTAVVLELQEAERRKTDAA